MKALKGIDIEEVVVFDIETATVVESIQEGTAIWDAWEYKMKRSSLDSGLSVAESFVDAGALNAEFSRIVCISVGRVKDGVVTITTYKDSDEAVLLRKFNRDLEEVSRRRPETRLCGHSLKAFDMPFVFKRSIANGVVPCSLIDTGGAKPWELTALDTKELWKGSGMFNSSLVSICLALNVNSPKQDITGADVGKVYYKEGEDGLNRIVDYCEQDVLATTNVLMKFMFREVFTDYNKSEPRELEELNIFGEIEKNGLSVSHYAQVIKMAKGFSVKEKKALIANMKAAMLLSGRELSNEVQLEIMSAK